MKAPNREEPHTDKAIWDKLEKQANADWRWHGIRMFILGLLVGLVALLIGVGVGLL